MKIWWGEKVFVLGKLGIVLLFEEDGFIVVIGNEIVIKVIEF